MGLWLWMQTWGVPFEIGQRVHPHQEKGAWFSACLQPARWCDIAWALFPTGPRSPKLRLVSEAAELHGNRKWVRVPALMPPDQPVAQSLYLSWSSQAPRMLPDAFGS